MLDPWLIEAEKAYRHPLSLEGEDIFMAEEKLIDTENKEEHYVRKGDPKKPTYYIIRPIWPNAGLFGHAIPFVGHIRYALSKGWLPVIDMQNYPNSYLEPEKLGKENAWEYFFEQPLRIGLEEAYSGENIVICKQVYSGMTNINFRNTLIHDSLIEWRMMVKLGLFKIKPEIMEEILAVRAKLIAPTDRVLGVYLRGTDYAINKPKYHPIPPPPEYAITVVLEKIREWKCNKIFLSTEDKNIVQFFKDTFGDGFGTFCVTIDREYADCKPGQIYVNSRINRENDRFLTAKDYLTELVILSKCNSLVFSKTYGMMGVMILAEKFENVYAFDLGAYGIHPKVDWRKLIGQ